MLSMIIKIAKSEALPGVLLFVAGCLAFIVSNSSLHEIYDNLLTTDIKVSLGKLSLNKPILLWINDGLMAVFFLLIGLEIKREILEGHLSKFARMILPAVGAVGGVLVPALIFAFLNKQNSDAMSGWAIPTATDIAFALGVLIILGKRIPQSLRVLLVTIAIFDDLSAITIIAIWYSTGLSYLSLLLALCCIAILLALNFAKVRALSLYMVVGAVLWVCVLKSGVHATLAGVVLAFTIPLHVKGGAIRSPLLRLEMALNPWVAFFILPAFAFANAGVSLDGLFFSDIFEPVPLGIAAGLFFGKQLGIFSFAWLGVLFGIAELPRLVTWRHVYGMSLLCGIGFTMSLFISSLAYNPDNYEIYAVTSRLGVILGSLFSALFGYLFLLLCCKKSSRNR